MSFGLTLEAFNFGKTKRLRAATLTRLVAKPPFLQRLCCKEKIDLSVCSIRLGPIFSCVLPFGKDRLFAVGILGLTGTND